LKTTPPKLRPPCEEKDRLRVLYSAAAEHYTAAVNDVNLSRGNTAQGEYSRVRELVYEARTARDVARRALEQHKQEHGC
jgi:hypothetical protein